MRFVVQASIIIIIITFTSFKVESNEPNSTIDLNQLLKLKNQKYLMTPPKSAKKIFTKNLMLIEAECCEEDFPKKDLILSIKSRLNECLDTDCHKKLIPIYDPKKPPLKIIAFIESEKIDDLIIEHSNFKYQKLTSMNDTKNLENKKKEEIIKEFQTENKKLKSTVDKMLINYQTKIANLESENEKLKEDFKKAFNMLPKNKQKKFD